MEHMHDVLPEGEDLRRAVKWVSGILKDEPDRSIGGLVNDAIFRFDLSPKDGEFLARFFRDVEKHNTQNG
jgi:hypothetical protein